MRNNTFKIGQPVIVNEIPFLTSTTVGIVYDYLPSGGYQLYMWTELKGFIKFSWHFGEESLEALDTNLDLQDATDEEIKELVETIREEYNV